MAMWLLLHSVCLGLMGMGSFCCTVSPCSVLSVLLLAFISIVLSCHCFLNLYESYYSTALNCFCILALLQASRAEMSGEIGQEQLHMAKKIQRSARRSAFFKVLTGDFSQQLRIPSAFIKNLNRCLLQNFRLKGPSGQCWYVKFEKRGNQLFFYRGWEEFVKHHPLEVGDFLVFSYDGVSMFDVRIYGKTFCDKNVKPAQRISDRNGIAARRSDVLPRRSDSGKRKATDQAKETPFPFQSDNAFVCRTLKRSSSLYEVNVPIAVIRKEGYRAGETLKVKDAFGNRFWYVKLCCTLNGYRLAMRSGIARICQENKTSPGDSIVFEFVKRGVVQVHIIRAGTC